MCLFLAGKQVVVKKFDSVQEDERQIDPNRNRWKEQEDSLKNEEDIAESGRIFVRNLAYTTAENDIEELFSKFGLFNFFFCLPTLLFFFSRSYIRSYLTSRSKYR